MRKGVDGLIEWHVASPYPGIFLIFSQGGDKASDFPALGEFGMHHQGPQEIIGAGLSASGLSLGVNQRKHFSVGIQDRGIVFSSEDRGQKLLCAQFKIAQCSACKREVGQPDGCEGQFDGRGSVD